jgi:hypothetical protein
MKQLTINQHDINEYYIEQLSFQKVDEPVPANDWMISVASTALLFICLNVTIVVEIYKNFHEIGLLRKVSVTKK